MSKFMIENAQITKASTFEPIVFGNTPEVVNIASTLGKVAEYYDEIETINNTLPQLQNNIDAVYTKIMGFIKGSTGVNRYKFQIGLKPGYAERIRVPVRITCAT